MNRYKVTITREVSADSPILARVAAEVKEGDVVDVVSNDFTPSKIKRGQLYRHRNFPNARYIGAIVKGEPVMIVVNSDCGVEGGEVSYRRDIADRSFWNNFYSVVV